MRNGEPGWFASLLGAGVLIAGGFALGLVAGVVSEEPELVVGHLVGRSDEVAWAPEGEPEFTGAGGDSLAEAPAAGAGDGSLLAALPDIDEPDFAPVLDVERDEAPEVPALAPELPAVAAAPPARRGGRDISSIPSAQAEPEHARRPSREAPRAGFAVQVGAFADADSAESVRGKLAQKGFESYVSSDAGDGKWRVRVGPVSSRPAAEALAGRLKSEERLPTWVLSEGGG